MKEGSLQTIGNINTLGKLGIVIVFRLDSPSQKEEILSSFIVSIISRAHFLRLWAA